MLKIIKNDLVLNINRGASLLDLMINGDGLLLNAICYKYYRGCLR